MVEEERGEPAQLAEAELRRGDGCRRRAGRRARRRRAVRAAGLDLRPRARDDRAGPSTAAPGAAAADGELAGSLRRAADRARGQALGGLRPARKAGAPGRRPPLHGSGLPPGHAGDGGHPAGGLRPGAVAAARAPVGRCGRRPGAPGSSSTSERFGLAAVRGRTASPAAGPCGRRPGAPGSSSTCPSASRSRSGPRPGRFACTCSTDPDSRRHGSVTTCRLTGLPGPAPRMGLRALEEPRRLRARARRARGPRGLCRALDCRWTRSSSTRPGRASTTPGASTRIQFPDPEAPGRPASRGGGPHGGLGHAVGEPRFRRRPAPGRPRVGAPAHPTRGELRRGCLGGPLRAGCRRPALGGALVDGQRLAGRLHVAGGPALVASPGASRARAGDRGHQGRRRRGLLPAARRPLRGRAPRRRGGLAVRRALPADHAEGARRGPSGRPASCSAARGGPASRRPGSPGAAIRPRTSGPCGRWWPQR